MKQVFIILCFFCVSGAFAQVPNTSVSSDKRAILPALVTESVNRENSDAISLSDALPVTGQKYETSQRHTLLLVPVGDVSGKTADATNEKNLIMSGATPLPASASSVPQSDKLILVPVNTQKP